MSRTSRRIKCKNRNDFFFLRKIGFKGKGKKMTSLVAQRNLNKNKNIYERK